MVRHTEDDTNVGYMPDFLTGKHYGKVEEHLRAYSIFYIMGALIIAAAFI